MTDLFTQAELEALIESTLTAPRATLLRELATSAVRGACGQTLTAVAGDVSYLRVAPGDYQVRLPQRPVTAVTTVKTIADSDGTTESVIPTTDWRWDRAATITTQYVFGQSLLKVTYSHGSDDATFLSTAKRVALQCAARLAGNPAGAQSHSIDDFSESFDTSSGADGAAQLTAGEVRDLRRAYGVSTQSVPVSV